MAARTTLREMFSDNTKRQLDPHYQPTYQRDLADDEFAEYAGVALPTYNVSRLKLMLEHSRSASSAASSSASLSRFAQVGTGCA